jgi:hypothetical protein
MDNQSALLGLDHNIADEEGLDLIAVNYLFNSVRTAGKLNHGGLGVDHKVHLSTRMVATHIPRIHLQE